MRTSYVAPGFLSLLIPALFAFAFACGESEDGVEIHRAQASVTP